MSRRSLRRILPPVAFVLLATVAGSPWGRAPRGAGEGPRAVSAVNLPPAPPVLAASAEPEREPATAPTPASARPLFAFVAPPDAAELTTRLLAPATEVHYVQVNGEVLAGKRSPFWQPPGEGRLEVPLPDGRVLPVTIEGSEMLGPDRFSSVGHIAGLPLSRAVFAVSEDQLHASLEAPGLGSFVLRAAAPGLAQFYQVAAERVGPCGGARRPGQVALPGRPAAMSVVLAPVGLEPAIAANENPQRAEIHLLVVHTPAVLPTFVGPARTAALQSAFDAAVAKVNAAFAASLVTARVKLVGIHETRYDETLSASNRVQDDALTALYRADDGLMDDIHAVRDRVGADVVCLALQRPDTASSGLSFLLTPDRNDNAEYAFSVVQYGNIAGTNVVAHELGHVLGCAHDRQNAGGATGAFPYSFGYRFTGADGRQYHDIMSYPPGTELSYFSNPDVIVPAPVNTAIGIPAGRTGESNTAGTIERTAFLTSTYRLQTQAAPNPGALINVATRAFVGRDEQVLIGGFVVSGTQPKRILVRGVGPALRSFGVLNALPDPVLTVYSGPRQVGANDTWSTAGDGVDAATAQVGGFPFLAGSADAALLLTLAPGAYTAVVEGSAGSTGIGMVEAYDVDRSADRIVNLATRGYVDRNGREMHGGFVVRGQPGETKRILVRVLGPSLARAPFNLSDTLDDPQLEVRSATGDLLVANDDWSLDSRGGITPENDFFPQVVTYGERQIFATGFAPGNRREPCVLMDLPPGSYTVVVTPFELRTSSPLTDQPAVPGVGIVEVYEINP